MTLSTLLSGQPMYGPRVLHSCLWKWDRVRWSDMFPLFRPLESVRCEMNGNGLFYKSIIEMWFVSYFRLGHIAVSLKKLNGRLVSFAALLFLLF